MIKTTSEVPTFNKDNPFSAAMAFFEFFFNQKTVWGKIRAGLASLAMMIFWLIGEFLAFKLLGGTPDPNMTMATTVFWITAFAMRN